MGQLGFGYGGKGRSRLLNSLAATAGGGAQIAQLTPSSGWTGIAGSGFTLTPVDPARTTAKPIVRPIDPPSQYFTDELTYSVMTFANDGGTMIGGIDRVRFHFEGRSVDVVTPMLREFTRYDGTKYSLPCYTVKLKKPAGVSGIANLYVEAIPADATMQSRVLGPFEFSPVDTLHDWDKTIGTSGADYTTVSDAVAAAKTANAQNPRVTFITSGTYDLTHGSPVYTPRGYMTSECAPGVAVTFAKASYTTDTAMSFRTRWDGMWFKGAGFTFDFALASEIFHEAQTSDPFAVGRSHVFEGVRFTRSTPRGSLIRKTLPGGTATWSVRGSPWMLECDIHNMQRPGRASSLVRGCTFRNGFADVDFGSRALIGCTVDTWGSQLYRTRVHALTVQYNGAGATATLSLTGTNTANNRVMTARVNGDVVDTFTIQNTQAAFDAGTNYNVANVVDWLNGLADWTATLEDDTRLAAALTTGEAGFGAFTNVDVKTAPLELFTAFDIHTDFYQKDASRTPENVLIYGNVGTEIDAQLIMIGGNESRDWAIINNALDIVFDSEGNPGGDQKVSQFSREHSHVIFAHNTFPEQRLALRTGTTSLQQYDPDTYCLVANNSVRDIRWDNAVDPDLLIANNHLHGSAIGVSGIGGTQGGNQFTLYANFDAGDFTPAGDLTGNLKAPAWAWDINANLRGATASPGAFSGAET